MPGDVGARRSRRALVGVLVAVVVLVAAGVVAVLSQDRAIERFLRVEVLGGGPAEVWLDGSRVGTTPLRVRLDDGTFEPRTIGSAGAPPPFPPPLGPEWSERGRATRTSGDDRSVTVRRAHEDGRLRFDVLDTDDGIDRVASFEVRLGGVPGTTFRPAGGGVSTTAGFLVEQRTFVATFVPEP